MMIRRFLVGFPALLFVPSFAQAAPFDFMGIEAGVLVDKKLIWDCRDEEDGGRLCKARDKKVAGIEGVTHPLVWIYGGKLSSLTFGFPNSVDNYPRVLAALTEKYGPPCRSFMETWRNRMGTELDNEHTVWCFDTGELVLQQFGSRVNWSSFTYSDTVNIRPVVRPKVDF